MMLLRSAAAAAVLATAAGHGAMTKPRSRNTVDGDTGQWAGPVPVTPVGGLPFTYWCPAPDADSKDPRKLTGSNGQAW
eukprot:SAG22_NODE_3020_length_2018_cov_3.003127_1_plen_78_part_00